MEQTPSIKPAVSIIIPTYNRSAFLQEAIDSVLAQSYSPYEIIVVDDGSADDTPEVVKAYESKVRYIRRENSGPAAARNTGIKAARSDYIAFLDDDDRFDKRKLEIQVKAMVDNPGFLVSHTQEIWFRRGKHLNQKIKHRKEGGDIFSRCLELCAVGMSTSMVRKELFNRVGLFDETMRCCEDYDLWLRVSAAHEFFYIDKPLTIKNGGRPDQVSYQNRVGMDTFRIEAIRKIIASGQLSPEQKGMAEAELRKKCRIYGQGCMKHGRPDEGLKYLSIAGEYVDESQ